MKLKIIAAFAGAMLASACSTMSMMGAPARPECANKSYTIYYSYQEDDLRASAGPVIHNISEYVSACERAGGKLRGVTVVGFPNKADESVGGDKTAHARGQAVLEALVSAGLPAKLIKLTDHNRVEDDVNQPMRRRAEIELKLR